MEAGSNAPFSPCAGSASNTLLKVELPIVENKVCSQWYEEDKKSSVITDTSICAGLEAGGKDACQVRGRWH